jgi:hypothetical protein
MVAPGSGAEARAKQKPRRSGAKEKTLKRSFIEHATSAVTPLVARPSVPQQGLLPLGQPDTPPEPPGMLPRRPGTNVRDGRARGLRVDLGMPGGSRNRLPAL